jgi:hypothetical protein
LKPINNLAEVRRVIESFEGEPEEFALPISDELQDLTGMNMAIITDYILAKGWEPNGYEQRDGFRIYRYKAFD